MRRQKKRRFAWLKQGVWVEQRVLLCLIVLMFAIHLVASILNAGAAEPPEWGPDFGDELENYLESYENDRAFRAYNLVAADVEAAVGSLSGRGEAMPTGDVVRELATLTTCNFLHGDWSHVGFNMLYLWIFGAILVELVGWRWMLATFFLTGLSGSILYVIFNSGSEIPSLGASGAVMGFEGAYLALVVRWRLPNPFVWPIASPIPPVRLALLAVIGTAMDIKGILGNEGGVAFSAHLGGLFGGLIIASFLMPKPKSAQARG